MTKSQINKIAISMIVVLALVSVFFVATMATAKPAHAMAVAQSTPTRPNIALNKPVSTISPACGPEYAYGPQKIVNGSWTDGVYQKWCTAAATKWIQIDLGRTYRVNFVGIYHASAGGEWANYNTRDYSIQSSVNGISYTTQTSVTGNTAGLTTLYKSFDARFVRLTVTQGAQVGFANIARIYEIVVNGN